MKPWIPLALIFTCALTSCAAAAAVVLFLVVAVWVLVVLHRAIRLAWNSARRKLAAAK